MSVKKAAHSNRAPLNAPKGSKASLKPTLNLTLKPTLNLTLKPTLKPMSLKPTVERKIELSIAGQFSAKILPTGKFVLPTVPIPREELEDQLNEILTPSPR